MSFAVEPHLSNGALDVGRKSFENWRCPMPSGTVKKLVADRGFGFIVADDGKEYFFHRDSVDRFDSLRGGEQVTFQVEPSPKGPRAAQVTVS
jgi:cold shock protein